MPCTFLYHNLVSADWLYWASGNELSSVTSASSSEPTSQAQFSSHGSSKERNQMFYFSNFSTEAWQFPLLYVNWQRSSLLKTAFGLVTYSWFNNYSHSIRITWSVRIHFIASQIQSCLRELIWLQGLMTDDFRQSWIQGFNRYHKFSCCSPYLGSASL